MSENLEVKVGKFSSKNIWNRAIDFGKRKIIYPLIFASLLGCSGGGGSDKSSSGGAPTPSPTPGNYAPIIYSSPLTQVNENSQYSYDVDAYDSDNDPISYSLTQAPGWLSITPSTGLISGTAPNVSADTNYPITVRASDGKTFSEQSYNLTVKNVSSPPAASGTKVFSDSVLSTITSVETNAINFSQPVSGIEIGDIAVAGISAGTPYGYLAEVTGISSDRKTLITQPSSLEKAFPGASFSMRGTFLPGDVVSSTSLRGVSQLNALSGYNFSLTLDDVILFDADGNLSTTGDQVVANGSISFDVNYDFDFNIGDSRQLRRFLFQPIISDQSNLTVTSSFSGLVPQGNKKIWTYYFRPFVAGNVPIPIFPFVAPIIVTPIAEIYVGSTAVGFQSQASVNQNATFTAGIEFNNGIWTPTSSLSNTFTFSSPTNPLKDSYANVSASQVIGLYIMGLLGPYGQVNGILEYSSDNLRWDLKGGLEALLGVKTGIIGINALNYSRNVIDYERTLASGDFPVSPPTPTGKIAFARGDGSYADIWTMNPDGSNAVNRTDGSPNSWNIGPSWFPDGSKIVFASKVPFGSDDFDIYKMNADGSGKTLLIAGSMNESNPVISPDGTRMAYGAGYVLNQIYVVSLNNLSNPVEKTSDYSHNYSSLSWFPDGNSLAFVSNRDHFAGEIYRMNLSTDVISRLTNDSYYDRGPSVCPTNGKIAWASNRSGNYEIWAMNSDGTNKVNVSNSAGTIDEAPSWNPDCSKITYSSRSNTSSSLRNEIWTMNADGSGKTQLTNNSYNDSSPSWSLR